MADADLNLKVLQRADPAVTQIIDSAKHVSVYFFKQGSWEKQEIDGSLFIVRRSQEPAYRIIVINRLSTNNMIEDIALPFMIQLADPYLMYRNARGEIHGLWFYAGPEREKVQSTLEWIVQTLSSSPTTAEQQTSRMPINPGDSAHRTQPAYAPSSSPASSASSGSSSTSGHSHHRDKRSNTFQPGGSSAHHQAQWREKSFNITEGTTVNGIAKPSKVVEQVPSAAAGPSTNPSAISSPSTTSASVSDVVVGSVNVEQLKNAMAVLLQDDRFWGLVLEALQSPSVSKDAHTQTLSHTQSTAHTQTVHPQLTSTQVQTGASPALPPSAQTGRQGGVSGGSDTASTLPAALLPLLSNPSNLPALPPGAVHVNQVVSGSSSSDTSSTAPPSSLRSSSSSSMHPMMLTSPPPPTHFLPPQGPQGYGPFYGMGPPMIPSPGGTPPPSMMYGHPMAPPPPPLGAVPFGHGGPMHPSQFPPYSMPPHMQQGSDRPY